MNATNDNLILPVYLYFQQKKKELNFDWFQVYIKTKRKKKINFIANAHIVKRDKRSAYQNIRVRDCVRKNK